MLYIYTLLTVFLRKITKRTYVHAALPFTLVNGHARKDTLKGHIHKVISSHVPPEFGTLNMLEATFIPLPLLIATLDNLGNLRAVISLGVKQVPLFLSGA